MQVLSLAFIQCFVLPQALPDHFIRIAKNKNILATQVGNYDFSI